MHANIQTVGHAEVGRRRTRRSPRASSGNSARPTSGSPTQVNAQLRGAETPQNWMGGGSDDIGDVAWNVPTVTLRYPSNIPGLPGHNWANAISMATPIAHKGALAGAKVQALTLLDILLTPKVVADAWDVLQERADEDDQVQAVHPPVRHAADRGSTPTSWRATVRS